MPSCMRQLARSAISRPAVGPVSQLPHCRYLVHSPQLQEPQAQLQPLPLQRESLPPITRHLTASRRLLKRKRPSPSSLVVSALEQSGLRHVDASSNLNGKVDLSYVNARRYDRHKFLQHLARQHGQGYRKEAPSALSLHSIVAAQIHRQLARKSLTDNLDPPVHNSASFTKQELQLLRSRGYGPSDVHDWVSILINPNTNEAVRAILDHDALSAPSKAQLYSKKPIPVFVFLFILRRPLHSFRPETLRMALMHAWTELHRKHIAQLVKDGAKVDRKTVDSCRLSYPTIDDSSVMLMVVRLLRHARHISPDALVTVASLFTQNFRLTSDTDKSHNTIRLRRKKNISLATLAALYNRVLRLLALPASQSPFLSTPYAQRAQFDVLREMAHHSPPLTITREGYRAVAQVHLASKKTSQEREWDDLKAKSWPPWKEDRTGLDADKGPEYGVSMALRAMRHAANAGYGLGAWERVAHILTGWDLDGSPAIQTRAVLLHKYVSQQQLLKDYDVMDDTVDNTPAAWAARIQATRTVQEAWACFLTHKDHALKENLDSHPSAAVYHAMFEKLSASTLGAPKDGHDISVTPSTINAGDAKEVLRIPESPKEATYVRIEPPTMDELANEMFMQGINPDARTIALLVSRSHTLGQGIKYVRWAALRDTRIASLLSPTPEERLDLKDVPRAVFIAFIKLLCLFPKHSSRAESDAAPLSESPLAFAQRLLRAYRPGNRVPYHSIMRKLAFNQRPIGSDEFRLAASKTALERYSIMHNIIEHMHSMSIVSDSETFRIECSGLESAIFAALDLLDKPYMPQSLGDSIAIEGQLPPRVNQTSNRSHDVRAFAREIIETSAAKLRSSFFELMNGSKLPSHSNAQNQWPYEGTSHLKIELPRLLATPEPILLHYYIRVLGLLRDYDGFVELLEWMSTYRDEIETAASQPRGGKLLLRRSLVAVRVFTERAWVAYGEEPEVSESTSDRSTVSSNLAAPVQTRLKIKALVENLGWGAWPSDDEVEVYVQGGRFPGGNE